MDDLGGTISKRIPLLELDTNKKVGLIQKAIRQGPPEICVHEDSPVQIRNKLTTDQFSAGFDVISKHERKGREVTQKSFMTPSSRKRKASTPASRKRKKDRKTFNESLEMIKTLDLNSDTIQHTVKNNLTEIIIIDDSSDDERVIQPTVSPEVSAIEPRPVDEIEGPHLRSTDIAACSNSFTTSINLNGSRGKQSSIKNTTLQFKLDFNNNAISKSDAVSVPEFDAIKSEPINVEIPIEEIKQEESMEQLESCDQHVDETSLSESEFEDHSVPVELSEEDEMALKVIHNIKDCVVKMDELQHIHIYRYAIVASLGFSEELSSHGIRIKCTRGCKFQRLFLSYASIRSSCLEHFKKKHANDSSWNGFCSTCGVFVHHPEDPKKGEDKFTMESELDHIIQCHTSSNTKSSD